MIRKAKSVFQQLLMEGILMDQNIPHKWETVWEITILYNVLSCEKNTACYWRSSFPEIFWEISKLGKYFTKNEVLTGAKSGGLNKWETTGYSRQNTSNPFTC